MSELDFSYSATIGVRLAACVVLGTITDVLPLTGGLVLVLILITIVCCIAVAGRRSTPGCCAHP